MGIFERMFGKKKSAETRQKCVALRGHIGCVRAVGASVDGSIIATGSYDATVRLWDPTTGREVGRFNVESDIGTLAMSSDGTKVIIGCNSNFVEVWEVQTGHRLVQMKGHKSFPCSSMDYSRDGRWATSADWDEGGNTSVGSGERQAKSTFDAC
jgi:WD40 repeat protein